MQYSAAIIGLGNIGLKFDLNSEENNVFSHTKAYLQDKHFNLIAGIDSDSSSRDEFESYSGAKSYNNLATLKDDIDTVDIVSICTPTTIRLSIIKEIIPLKPKIIIIEKPIASTSEEAYKIKKIAYDNNIKVYVNYMRRVEPFFLELKNSINVGRVRSIVINYTNGLYTNASHFIDLAHYMFGKEEKISLISLKKMSNDYCASFVLFYKNFHIYFNGLENLSYSLGSMDILYDNKRLLIKDWGFDVENYELLQDPLFPDLSTLAKKEMDTVPDMEKYMIYVLTHVYNVLEGTQTLISSIDTSVETLLTCESIKDASSI